MADWDNLQTDIVGTIIRKLAIPDYIRFRAVCTSWNRVCACRDVSNDPRVDPWLMLPTKTLEDAKFFSLPERKNETIRILSTSMIFGSVWTPVGSSHGWLVFFNVNQGTIQLVNPISSAQFQLPPFGRQGLLECGVAVIYGDQKGYKVTCKGSKGWSSVDSKHILIDVFKHRSQLYTIDIYGTVELWAEPPRAWPNEDGLLVDPNLHHIFAPDLYDLHDNFVPDDLMVVNDNFPLGDPYLLDNFEPDEDGPDEDGLDENNEVNDGPEEDLLVDPNLHHNFALDEDDPMGVPYLYDNFEPDEDGPDEDDEVNDGPELDGPLVDPYQFTCLVETPAGDLMKVKRQSENKFAVWILNKGTSSFERTNDIGEYGLFVSHYSSFCLPAKDHPNLKANCVYFIDSYRNLCAINLEHGTKDLVEALETPGAQNHQDLYLHWHSGVVIFVVHPFTEMIKRVQM